jgi:ribonuclease HI
MKGNRDMKETWYAYTDGSCLQNPDGEGGWAAIVFDPEGNPIKISGYDESTTNQRMEIMAVIRALSIMPDDIDVVIYSDSQYVCKAFNDHWLDNWIKNGWINSTKKPVANKDLWLWLLANAKYKKITMKWVKGHASNILNNECDEMARSISKFANAMRKRFKDGGVQ